MAEQRQCFYFPPLTPREGTLISGFGVRPGRLSGAPTFHAGLDFGVGGAAVGRVPAYSVADARVQYLGREADRRGPYSGYGNAVVLRHVGRDEGFWTLYAHLDVQKGYMASFRDGGLILPAGSVVGHVGKTTNAKFAGMHQHLHFEVRAATSSGGSPFPGVYGPTVIPAGVDAVNMRRGHNVDPRPWLAARGIVFGYRGAIGINKAGACFPSESDSALRVAAALRAR